MNKPWSSVLDVVVATDGSADADRAVEWAAQEALERDAPLLILSAHPHSEDSWQGHQAVQEIVDSAAERVRREFPTVSLRTVVAEGDPREVLDEWQSRAAVVVLGSRGLNALRTVWLGSVSYWASRHLQVPTVVVRPFPGSSHRPDRRIAVGVDAGDSPGILRAAFEMASRRGCSVTIAHGWWDIEDPGTRWTSVDPSDLDRARLRAIEAVVAPVVAEFPDVSYEMTFGRGSVVEFLLHLAGTHHALVIGRKRVAPFDSLGLGTVATAVVEHALGVTVVVPVRARAESGEGRERYEYVNAQERLWVGEPVDSDGRSQLEDAHASHRLEHPVDVGASASSPVRMGS